MHVHFIYLINHINRHLTMQDGKRPDGLTLVPWQSGKHVPSDTTVFSTLAQSYLHASGHSAAGDAELAVSRKEAKYSCLPRVFLFVLIPLETLGQ